MPPDVQKGYASPASQLVDFGAAPPDYVCGAEPPENWKRGVEIKTGQDTRIGLDQLGRVRPTVHDANGNDVSRIGNIEVHSNDLTLCLNMSTTGVTELAPGTYDFRFWSSQLIYGWTRNVVIKAGQETPVEITVGK